MLGFVAATLLAVLGEHIASGREVQWSAFDIRHPKGDSSRAYDWCNATVTRMQIDNDNTYVVMPRDKPGVPFSLGVVPLEPNSDQPSISPFPNPEFHQLGNCTAIQNAVDIEFTVNGRLWVLDAGLANSPWYDTPRSCPPKLLEFMYFYQTDSYDVKILNLRMSNTWQPSKLFLEKVIFQQTYAYILDANNASLTIVDVANNELVSTVNLSDGVLTSIQNIALVLADEYTHYFYFTYSGSDKLFRITTHDLRDANYRKKIKTLGSINPDVSFMGSDNYHSIFFKISGGRDVYRWNKNIVESEKLISMQEDSGIPTIVALDPYERIWAISRRSTGSETGQCFNRQFQLSMQQLTSTSDPKLWCNTTVIGMQIYGGRAITALPRNKPGLPFSLGVMPLTEQSSDFRISVFPRWDVQELGNCHTIQNASDIKLTADGWIWVLDAGITNTPQDHTSPPCPPNLFRIKLRNDSEYDVEALNPTPIENWHPSKLFIDTTREGEYVVYFLDKNSARLSIFDVARKKMELTVDLSLGRDLTSIQGMALAKKNQFKYFYFTYSGSNKLLKIGTHQLRDADFLSKIVTIGFMEPDSIFLGSEKSLVFFNFKGRSEVRIWDNINHIERQVSPGDGSKIPSAVAVDSNGKIWFARRSTFDPEENRCPLPEVGKY